MHVTGHTDFSEPPTDYNKQSADVVDTIKYCRHIIFEALPEEMI